MTKCFDLPPVRCREAKYFSISKGGVAANHQIRKSLADLCKSQNAVLIVPKPEICADNGLMIAWVGGLKAHYNYPFDEVIKVSPRWILTDLHR